MEPEREMRQCLYFLTRAYIALDTVEENTELPPADIKDIREKLVNLMSTATNVKLTMGTAQTRTKGK